MIIKINKSRQELLHYSIYYVPIPQDFSRFFYCYSLIGKFYLSVPLICTYVFSAKIFEPTPSKYLDDLISIDYEFALKVKDNGPIQEIIKIQIYGKSYLFFTLVYLQ